tara:strand:- start:154 stop:1416 length:1263 start_codon:yes stop_codon:yes gene_type:complete
MVKNKKHKKILIIGGGLYACLLAYQLSKQNKYKILLIERAGKLLNNFNTISIGKFKLNNGFHAIEIPRCTDFVNFLTKKLHLKLVIRHKIHKLLINRFIIDSQDSFLQWPEDLTRNLRKNFIIKKNDNLNKFYKKKNMELIKICSKRFSKKLIDSKHMFIPWFLPKDYKVQDIRDEGHRFREKVRNKKIPFKYAVPKNKTFEILQKKFYSFLKKRKVLINFNTQVRFDKKYIELINNKKKEIYSYKEFDKIFYCSHAPFLLEYANQDHLKKLNKFRRYFTNCIVEIKKKVNFSEMICLNKNLLNINRISVVNSNKNRSFLQLEIYHKDKNLKKYFKNKIINELTIIFKLRKKPKYLGHKLSRVVFFPSINWKKNTSKFIKKWLASSKIKLNIRHDLSGAINMAKSWNYAKEDSMLKNRFL